MIQAPLPLHRFLVVGSTSRNAGKTSFSRNIIKTFGPDIIAVKITIITPGQGCPHGEGGCGVCSSLRLPYEISEETDREGHKDTAQLLKAGARRVYWLRVRKNAVAEGLKALLSVIDSQTPILCESNSIIRHIAPGLYIQLKPKGRKGQKESASELADRADLIVETTPEGSDFDMSRLSFGPSGWELD